MKFRFPTDEEIEEKFKEGPWFCERCGREWKPPDVPPPECPDDGGTICQGTP